MCTVDPSWPEGRLRQNCNGRLVSTGFSIFPPIGMILIQVAAVSLYFAFPARYFYDELNSSAPIVIGAILTTMFLGCFLATSLRDPGIIPRAEVGLYQIAELRPPRNQNLVSNCGRSNLRYCDHCNIFRPPKTEHCPTCNNCILRFDHHCPWVGNCIGLRNYRFFYGFIVSMCLFVCLAFSCAVTELILRNRNASSFDTNSAGSLALLIFCIVFGSFPFSLCSMHTYLVGSGKTTYDLFRRNFIRADDNPVTWRSVMKEFLKLSGPISNSLVRETYAAAARKKFEKILPEISPVEFIHSADFLISQDLGDLQVETV